MAAARSVLQVLPPPYLSFGDVPEDPRSLKSLGPGTAMVWSLSKRADDAQRKLVAHRPGGVALILVLPNAADLVDEPWTWELISEVRPHAILPHHRPVEEDIALVLRRPPNDLAVAVTDYLRWRGISTDADTRHLIRRTIELSASLSSVTALSRAVYLSRRALGRRFSTRGLPVPSHWLQFGRLLRFAIKLQNTDESVYTVACELGYADGFAASNQMYRLLGYRPSQVRARLGWEWLLETWLQREAEAGAFRPTWESVEVPDRKPVRPKGARRKDDRRLAG